MSTSLDYLFAAFDQSTENQCFATATLGIERHRLRIYSVESNQLTHDHDFKNNESITCLSWGTLQESKKHSKSKKALDKVVLAGTEKGSILLYSLEQDKVIKTVPGKSKIVDCLVNDLGTTIYSLSTDGTIVAWSLENDQPVSEWKTKVNGASKLALDQDILAVAGKDKIEVWNVIKGKIVKTIQSNAHNLLIDSHNHTLVSNSKNTIDLWNLKGKNTQSTQSLSVADGVKELDLISTNGETVLLAVTDQGTVQVWHDFTLKTTLKVMASKHNSVPILYAKFTKIQNQLAVSIARGSSAKPVLETVRIMDDKNKALHDIVLTRQSATDEQDSDDDDMDPHTPEKLTKALQLEDKAMILLQLEEEQDLDTIRSLPVAYIRPLVVLIVDEVQSRPVTDCAGLVAWLKCIVSVHYATLLADHAIVKKLSTLSRVLTVHATETLPKVMGLRGRVEMIQQQLDLRSKRAQLEQEDALFIDDSEEDDSDLDSDHEDDEDDFDQDEDRLKDQDMFMEEIAEDDVESDMDDSDASM